MSERRLEELIMLKAERQKREEVLNNNLSLRIKTLQERVRETEKITTNESPINTVGMLFQILENQEQIMESLINIQQKMLNDKKETEE